MDKWGLVTYPLGRVSRPRGWTGMHEPACMDRHAGMHEPACMLLQQLLLLRACVRAWSPAWSTPCISWFTARRRPRRGESNFRIEIFAQVRNGQQGELGGLPPELALLTVPNFREYFYTKIQISTPGSKFRCINLGSKSSGWPNIPVLICSLQKYQKWIAGRAWL